MSSSGSQLVTGPSSSSSDPSKSEESSGQGQRPGPGGTRLKRTLIESACFACRKRKSKCDGTRPVCARCQNLHTECMYEAQEGESRWSALRRRGQSVEQEREDYREVLSWMLVESDQEAYEALHRIRSAPHIDDILAIARHNRERGTGMAQAAPSSSPSSTEQRLPPIRTLIDVPVSSPVHSRPGFASEASADSYTESYSPTTSDRPPQNR